MRLNENERMARFKIEEVKELEAELNRLQSVLELELKFKEPILKKLGLNCEMSNILVSKSYC